MWEVGTRDYKLTTLLERKSKQKLLRIFFTQFKLNP